MTVPSYTFVQLFKFAAPLPFVVGAALLGAVRYRHLPASLRRLAWLAWFEMPLELWGTGLSFFRHNNLFIMPLYTVGELALLALVYGAARRSAAFSRTVPWVVGSFTAYALFDSLAAADLSAWFRPGQQVVQSLLILGLVGLYCHRLLQAPVPRLGREPLFWVSAGLALYFLGYLQIALFSNYMLRHYSLAFNRHVWEVHLGLFVLLHGCYCWALALRPASLAFGINCWLSVNIY